MINKVIGDRLNIGGKKGISLGDGACALAYAEVLIKRQSKDEQQIKQLLVYASEHENMSEDDWQTADHLLKEMST